MKNYDHINLFFNVLIASIVLTNQQDTFSIVCCFAVAAIASFAFWMFTKEKKEVERVHKSVESGTHRDYSHEITTVKEAINEAFKDCTVVVTVNMDSMMIDVVSEDNTHAITSVPYSECMAEQSFLNDLIDLIKKLQIENKEGDNVDAQD